MEGVLGPWLSAEAAFKDVSSSDPSHYRLVRQADDLFEAFDDGAPTNVDQLAELSLKHGVPTTFSPLFVNGDNVDAVERVMARVDEQFARGARV